jgi:hypothetical protein
MRCRSPRRQAAKPAFEANDIFELHRSPDRNRRPRRLLRVGGTPETGKGAMHLDNQYRDLVGRDLVMPHIAADDFGDLSGIDSGGEYCSAILCSLSFDLGRFF